MCHTSPKIWNAEYEWWLFLLLLSKLLDAAKVCKISANSLTYNLAFPCLSQINKNPWLKFWNLGIQRQYWLSISD
jgi:hypothetical protein